LLSVSVIRRLGQIRTDFHQKPQVRRSKGQGQSVSFKFNSRQYNKMDSKNGQGSSQLTRDKADRFEAAVRRLENGNHKISSETMDKKARLVNLIEKLKKMDEMQAADEESVFQRCYRPVHEKEEEIKKLEKELEDHRSRNPRSGGSKNFHATEITIMDKDTRTPKPYKLVDFAAMSANDVHEYDGRYGGEEAIRMRKREAAAITRERRDQRRSTEGRNEHGGV